MNEIWHGTGLLPWCQVAVPGLNQAVKAVAEQAGGEQRQQPRTVVRASHRTEDRVQPLHLVRAGQHRSLDQEETGQHEYDSARDRAERAQDMCPAVNRSRKLSRTARRPASRPPVTTRIPARTSSAWPHPVRSNSAVTPASCRCSDRAVCCAGFPVRSRAVLRQKTEYSTNPHDDTARCRHLPMVPVARAGRNTASSSWVSAYAASPATSSTSGIRPHTGATAACTAPALLAGSPARPRVASAKRKAR